MIKEIGAISLLTFTMLSPFVLTAIFVKVLNMAEVIKNGR